MKVKLTTKGELLEAYHWAMDRLSAMFNTARMNNQHKEEFKMAEELYAKRITLLDQWLLEQFKVNWIKYYK